MATEKLDKQGFMYGLDKFTFNAKDLGFIEDDSFDWGGAAGEVTEIMAAQKKGFPVKILPKSNGTQKPTFDLIQLGFENLAAVLGGEVVKENTKITGWKAPDKIVMITGEAVIETDSGHRITIPNCMLQAYIGGNLNMTSVSKIKCTLNIMEPTGGGAPYKIDAITIP